MDIQPSVISNLNMTSGQAWLTNRHGTDATDSITLDVTKFTAGTHYDVANALIRENRMHDGIPLGKVTSTGLYAPWVVGASDGTQNFLGILYAPTLFWPGATKCGGALLWHGSVDHAKLSVAFDPATLTASNNKTSLRFI